jgi:hypothetical protein
MAFGAALSTDEQLGSPDAERSRKRSDSRQGRSALCTLDPSDVVAVDTAVETQPLLREVLLVSKGTDSFAETDKEGILGCHGPARCTPTVLGSTAQPCSACWATHSYSASRHDAPDRRAYTWRPVQMPHHATASCVTSPDTGLSTDAPSDLLESSDVISGAPSSVSRRAAGTPGWRSGPGLYPGDPLRDGDWFDSKACRSIRHRLPILLPASAA